MAGRGRPISGESIQRVVHLLAATEMTMSEIAERMGYNKTTVVTINRKFQVRNYDGLRTRWREGSIRISPPLIQDSADEPSQRQE